MTNSRNTAAVVVVGSANVDLVVRADHIPAPGETVLGGAFAQFPGGKGANQAVAAARLGASCCFVGRVGDDEFADLIRDSLRDVGVELPALRQTWSTPTGVALIVVSHAGENAICVAPGANAKLLPGDIEWADALFEHSDICLIQLEIPIETVQKAIEVCRSDGVRVMLNPAPARDDLPPDLLAVDVLTPNRNEAALLTGRTVKTNDDAVAAARALRERGCRAVAMTLGADGALIADDAGEAFIPAFPVDVVDTTAAGDTFNGALAVELARGTDLRAAARFANAAAALACTRPGAQPSIPTRDAVEQFLAAPS